MKDLIPIIFFFVLKVNSFQKLIAASESNYTIKTKRKNYIIEAKLRFYETGNVGTNNLIIFYLLFSLGLYHPFAIGNTWSIYILLIIFKKLFRIFRAILIVTLIMNFLLNLLKYLPKVSLFQWSNWNFLVEITTQEKSRLKVYLISIFKSILIHKYHVHLYWFLKSHIFFPQLYSTLVSY